MPTVNTPHRVAEQRPQGTYPLNFYPSYAAALDAAHLHSQRTPELVLVIQAVNSLHVTAVLIGGKVYTECAN